MKLQAASITYEEVVRPTWVPPDVPNSGSRFLLIEAIDGRQFDAVLRMSADATSTTLVISVHGSGGNYAGAGVGILLRQLPDRGYAVLGINTRQENEKINTDNFFDIRVDIEAAVNVAKHLGFSRIVLHGHSLGNIQVQFFAATNWDKSLVGLILTGMFAALPWKSRHILIQDEQTYAKMSAEARSLIMDGQGSAFVAGGLPSRRQLGARDYVTAQHFVTYRDTSCNMADGTYWIRLIPLPILMIRDEADIVVKDFEPTMLLAAAKSEGSLVRKIDFVSLPNPSGPNEGGHSFRDTGDALIDTIVNWLSASPHPQSPQAPASK